MADYLRSLPHRRHWLLLLSMVAATPAAWAQDGAAARCQKVNGTLLTRAGQTWKAVKAGDNVAAGANLVALFEAELTSANKAVAVKLLGDIGMFGPLPVLDTAARLLEPGSADLALNLDHGLVIFTNTKESGTATVALKVHGQDLTVKLKSPGARLGIELYGRHPGGAVNLLKDNPTAFFFALVGEGDASIGTKDHTHVLTAPPGPAVLRWDSATSQADVVHLDKFPDALKRNDAEMQQFAKICATAGRFSSQEPTAAAVELLKSDDALNRRVAVTTFGAVDDLPHLLGALGDSQHADARDQAILVLRSWMGHAPGQLKALRGAMLKQKYTLPQMKETMHLLIGFDESEREHPGVYELLINLLDSRHLGVRELAHWHLVRLAPAGRDIVYDAGAAEADRQQGVERWRKLIPPGELPPRPKTDKK
jgi:hypothetical protein